MKKEIDPKFIYVAIALIAVVFVGFFIKTTGSSTVPASEIKAPAPPGGFPGGSRGNNPATAVTPD